MDRISEVIVFVAEDEMGNEGIVTMQTPGLALPMVFTDADVPSGRGLGAHLNMAVDKARELARSSGRTIKVLRFAQRAELLTIEAP